jgi:hypothetical protein
MNTVLMSAADWAQTEFGAVESGDQRRNERLVQVCAALARRPSASLPQAMEGRAELKAAYRLFHCEELTHSTLLSEHCARTQLFCQQRGRFLLIEDTTQLDFSSHPATVGLGPIGDGRQRGFLLHTTLALKLGEGGLEGDEPLGGRLPTEVVGIFAQKLWIRPEPEPGQKSSTQQSTFERQKRARESQRWAAVFEEVRPCSEAQWIYVADRESDVYECLQRCRDSGVDFVIRACQSRALLEKEGLLFEEVAQAPLLGTTTVHLRARPGVKARTVTLELRASSVEVRPPKRPGKKLEPLKLTVVEARECPKEAEANHVAPEDQLHWVLITSLPVESFAQALEVVAIYRERWLIEDYHKALKTGTAIERVQLASAQALESVIGITAVLAARLLGLQLLAAHCPEKPLPADCSDPEILAVLECFYGAPENGWTVGAFLRAIARLGGFLGRKSDGNPGWITIWRGSLQLSAILKFKALSEKCG